MRPALRPVCLENLPVWRAPELAHAHEATIATGHGELDAVLPGGGWPVGALIEVLQDRAGAHVWQLWLPALGQVVQRQPGPIVLVDAPFEPFGPALQAQGIALERLLRVRADRAAQRLWAAEQALRCAQVPAVLAWLPQAKATELRRLNLAAAQHDKLLVVFRTMRAAHESSPARLRLAIADGESLNVRVLKRRGPPIEHDIALPAHPPRLAKLLASRQGGAPVSPPQPKERSHVLDRLVALA